MMDRPVTIRGAFVTMGGKPPMPQVLAFRYNPTTLTRTYALPASKGAPRISSPPRETISLTLELDAADELIDGSAVAATVGLRAQLSALEQMVYPAFTHVVRRLAKAKAGVLGVVSPPSSITLFVWGPERVTPVRLKTLSVTEQSFDHLLNPLRASVTVTLEVLTYEDLPPDHLGFALSMRRQVARGVESALSTGVDLVTILGRSKP